MKRSIRFPVLVAVLGVLAGCASERQATASAPADTGRSSPYALALKEGEALEGSACGEEPSACPDGQMCARLNLGEKAPLQCVDLRTICDRFECGEGRQCVVLESYPPKIQCGSRR